MVTPGYNLLNSVLAFPILVQHHDLLQKKKNDDCETSNKIMPQSEQVSVVLNYLSGPKILPQTWFSKTG